MTTDISPNSLRALATKLSRMAGGYDPDEGGIELLQAVDTALRSIADRDEAAGWVRVPVEPTEEMIRATGLRPGAVVEPYRAMIAAAPKGGEG